MNYPTFSFSVYLLALVACGGAPSAANDASDADARSSPSEQRASGDSMEISADVGAMDARKVKKIISRMTPAVQRCVASGQRRLPYLGGDIEVFVRVNGGGKAVEVLFQQSTLGDHKVESCIRKAFQSQRWPRPVGGKSGEVNQRFSFQSGFDDELRHWSSEQLATAMAAERDGGGAYQELVRQLAACRADAGTESLSVTTYLDEDGMAQAVGIASPDAKGAQAFSCVEAIITTTSFPSPGSSFAKVTVSVQ